MFTNTNRSGVLKKYIPKIGREQKLKDLYLLAKTIIDLEMGNEIKYKFLRHVIWSITTVDGTYNTKYRSKSVLSRREVPINHEHVWTVKQIREELLKNPENYQNILDKKAIGCIVTREEHNQLPGDKRGWERYKNAGIIVMDCEIWKRFL
ncbi:MAG: hypothetical protein HY519_00840 [Candidatus Aenigmarchaeota archaeon]|nr:hypothetical protein [Candidatus Aenigmarchaeota archaeon]